MLFHHYHFHFFGDRKLHALYLTIGLLYFAEGLISIFVPLYLWGLGFAIWRILLFYSLLSFYFLFGVLVLLPFIHKLNDRMMMFLSIPFLILFFLGLSYLTRFSFLFYLLPAFSAFNMLFFNTGFHVGFTASSDDKHGGREVSIRDMTTAVAQFSAPLLGGFLIMSLGYRPVFVIGIAILIFSAIPLLFIKQTNMLSRLRVSTLVGFMKSKTLRPFNISGFGYASERSVGLIVWTLFLFLALGSVEAFGGVKSAGFFAGTIVMYLAGFLSDRGRRRKILVVVTSFFVLVWLSRIFLISPALLAVSYVIGRVLYSGIMVSWTSQYYEIARHIGSPSAFILSREALYHLSRVIVLPVLLFLSAYLPLNTFFTISFIIAALLGSLFLFANKMGPMSHKTNFL